MPKFDNSSISCHSTTISGLSFDDIKYFASQACPEFQLIHDAQSSPKISRIRSGGGQEVTFQLDYNFAGHPRGSNFSLGYEACMEGFTYALLHCDDKDGDLYQNGLVHATFETVPMTFLTSVVESGSEKREDHDEDVSRLSDAPNLLGSTEATRSNSEAMSERSSTENSVPVVFGQVDLPFSSGLVVFDKVLYDCAKSSDTNTCCAKGPWIPVDQAANLSSTFCDWLGTGNATIELGGPNLFWVKHMSSSVNEYFAWHYHNTTETLSRSQCELWMEKLKGVCTTSAAGFTGGSLYVNNFQFFVKVTGANDDDGKELRRDLAAGQGEEDEVLVLEG
ncbi:hypothetical protein PRZ48_004584 [Zasmidium cellare]|uniref:Uncharacterized protein n=1 Tax=Zasmidium cellare TaxID=395010 RepID=A0ABR0EQM5_ZASCE|nr:hypothetical protein PRZ48_004584 [Zasmidium cellare]